MADSPRPLLLLDAASLYYRAFFGDKGTILAPDGSPVGAVRGFLDMIGYLVRERRPAGLVACWDDDWRPAFRVEAVPSYKAHRLAADGGEDAPPELGPQVDVIVEVLAALGIARVGAAGCEADDVIGTLTTRALAVGESVEIATGDRDLFQLVGPGVEVLYTARGVRNLDVIDVGRLAEKYAVASGDAYADLAALRGDASDGLPGVAGIGEKTAAALLARFDTLDGIIAAAADPRSGIPAGQRAKLIAGLDYLAVAPGVVRVLRDAELPACDPAIPREAADPEALTVLASRWGLGSSLERLQAALAAAG